MLIVKERPTFNEKKQYTSFLINIIFNMNFPLSSLYSNECQVNYFLFLNLNLSFRVNYE